MPTPILILAVTLNAIVGQLVLKYAVSSLGGAIAFSNVGTFVWSAIRCPLVYLSVTIQGIGYLLWMLLVSRMKLGPATAAVGGGFYLGIAFAAWAIHGEGLSVVQWLGLGLVSAGVVCIGLSSS